MKKKTIALLGLAALLAIAAIVSSPVSADDDVAEEADGVWCYAPDFTQLTEVEVSADYVGPKEFFQTVENAEWTGTFSGDSLDFGVVGFTAAGPTTFSGTVIFESVDVKGTSGGLEFDVFGGREAPLGDWTGTWIITGGSGGLAELQGHGDWWGPGFTPDTPPGDCGVIYYSVEDLDGIDDDDDDDDEDDDDDDDDDDDEDDED